MLYESYLCLQVKNRASAVGRRFSSQYVVHRDYGRGSKRLFDTPVQNSGLSSLNCAEKSGSHVKSENHTWPVIDSFGQVSLYPCFTNSGDLLL